ncbi:MAG: FkbM family methyltransferase [Halioglobus sp.]|nr:FkbM family methyltransferase [Halioglobus sp.]
MPLKLPSPYELKLAFMYPRKVYMRHRENLEPGFLRSALELHYYRPAFYDWMGAINANRLLLHEADINSESVVLDAGAYTGEWAQEIIDRYNPTIHAFEPDPRNYKQLVKRSANNERLIPYKYGLGDKNETAQMALEHLGSSIFSDTSGKNGVPSAEVEIRDIADIWRSLALGQIDLMKINIEGGEFPLLERMIETGLLKNVNCFMIQFHEWHPGAYHRRRKIRKALGKYHKLDWDYHFIWEKWSLR